MATNVTRIVSDQDIFNATAVIRTRVKILPLSVGDEEFLGTMVDWPEAFCKQLVLRTGPPTSQAIISLPVPKGGGGQVGGAYGFNPWTTRGTVNPKITPFTANLFKATSASRRTRPQAHYKVQVLSIENDDDTRIDADSLLFVGYITSLEPLTQGKDHSEFVVIAEDARYFMRKQFCEGAVYWNPTFQKFVYIRDHTAVFNKGGQADRMVDPKGITNRSGIGDRLFPAFIRALHNRYDADPASANFRRYIADSVLQANVTAGKVGSQYQLRGLPGPFAGDPIQDSTFAAKWTPGDVWNFYRYIFLEGTFGIAGFPDIGLIDDPASVTLDDIPPMWSKEINVQILHLADDATTISTVNGPEWFEPRSQVGQAPGGAADRADVTGLGEFSAAGMNRLAMMYHLCRAVGNQTLGVKYHSTGSGVMRIFPFRTMRASGDSNQIGIGINPGQAYVLQMPTDDDDTVKPDVISAAPKAKYENFFPAIHMKGGKRWIQQTVSTMGSVEYTDHLGYFHEAYAPADPNEWRPWTSLPLLMPGWTLEEQTGFLAQPDIQLAQMRFPKVFRDYVIPNDQDLKQMWDQGTNAGFRRFFERNRQIMTTLIASVYESAAGIYRSDRVKLPMFIWRAFRGIRVKNDGSTKFGDSTTESKIGQTGKGPTGDDDLFLVQPSFQPLADGGRIGVRFATEARSDFEFPFEIGTQGPASSPWAWNGLTEVIDLTLPTARERWHARPYEIFWTFAMETDEDVFDDRFTRRGGMPIVTAGPRMALVRDAGNEYPQELAARSMLALPFSGKDKVPDPDGPQSASQVRIYNDGSEEVKARRDMLADRHFAVDFNTELTMRFLDPSIEAGQTFAPLERSLGLTQGSEKINLQTIASTVVHDFENNATLLSLGTIR